MPMFLRPALALLMACAPLCLASAQSTPVPALEELAPGVNAPAVGSMLVVDTSVNPARVLTLHATEIKTNMHAGGNFARSMVYANQHHAIEVPGEHAAVSITSTTPAIYARLPQDDPELARMRLSLLMLRVTKDSREVMDFSNNVFGGGHKRNLEEVAITKEDAAGGRWVRIQPQKALEPGEYALVTLPKDKLLMPEVIYDFSVGKER